MKKTTTPAPTTPRPTRQPRRARELTARDLEAARGGTGGITSNDDWETPVT